MSAELSADLAAKVDAVVAEMAAMDRIVIAFSGGVDSTVVAALARRAVGDGATAVTAVSETLAGRELDDSKQIAAELGVDHRLVEFSELDDPRFRANTPARCFFCQSMRFDQLGAIADTLDCEVLAAGTNASDLGEHRPGLDAMDARRVYQPLADHCIDKDGVRQIARWLGLSVWNKPAKACLSSRIPHGLAVTDGRLRRIERAEEVLHAHDFSQFRVRDHDGLARIEVASAELDRLLDADRLRSVAADIRQAGFEEVAVDMAGYRSGSLNPSSP